MMTNTTTEVSELVAFKRKVWAAAIKVKQDEGWCNDGFNDAMDALGLPPYPDDNRPEFPYRPFVQRQRKIVSSITKRIDPCGNPGCNLCYNVTFEDEPEEEFEARVKAEEAQYERDLASYNERLDQWERDNSPEALINE